MRSSDKNYYTPWKVTLDKSWQDGFRQPPPRHEHTDTEYAQIVASWKADKAKFEQKADSLIWGSGMEHPSLAVGLRSGKPVLMDDSGVIVRVRGASIPDGGPSPKELSQRIVDCVNACEGIKDPAGFINKAKEFIDE